MIRIMLQRLTRLNPVFLTLKLPRSVLSVESFLKRLRTWRPSPPTEQHDHLVFQLVTGHQHDTAEFGNAFRYVVTI